MGQATLNGVPSKAPKPLLRVKSNCQSIITTATEFGVQLNGFGSAALIEPAWWVGILEIARFTGSSGD